MITKEEVMNLAVLAKIEIPDSELDDAVSDMRQMVKFAEIIRPSGKSDGDRRAERSVCTLRSDEPCCPCGRNEILENAADVKDGYFSLYTNDGSENDK